MADYYRGVTGSRPDEGRYLSINEGKADSVSLRCRLLGHRFRFSSEGEIMHWRCQRQCGAGGAKQYQTAWEAERYARAFDREDREDLGRRAPLIGLLPLRLARAVRERKQRSGARERKR